MNPWRSTLSRRRSRRVAGYPVAWLIPGVAMMIILAAAAMGLWAWHQHSQLQRLQADMMQVGRELEALQREHKATNAQFLALQGTATVLADRTATLEAREQAQEPAVLPAQEVVDLQAALSGMQRTVNGLKAEVDDLALRMETLESTQGEAAPILAREAHLRVARQQQGHNLSCESSAVSMVAGYHGVPLSEAEALAALPLNANPHLGFRGNVDGPTGGLEDYGVYAGPILELLNKRGLRAWPVEDGLGGIKAALARGNPVIVWVTYNCQPGTPTVVSIDGQEVTLVPYQHVVVVTGYDTEGVWANDPWDGQEDFYPFADFERAMSYFDDMAIEVAAP